MANKTQQQNSANQDQVTTSTRSRASSARLMNSSMNQINANRLQEKNELQNLNDRLANQFANVRELQKERQNLYEQIRIKDENHEIKLNELKESYEKQLEHLRIKLDEECTNSAKKLIDFNRFKQVAKEKQSEVNQLENDLKKAEKTISSLSNELESLKHKVNTLINENEQLRKLAQNLEIEKNSLDKSCKNNLAKAETEKLRSISLESKIQVLEDKLAQQKEFYEKELEDLRITYEEQRETELEELINQEVECYKTEIMMRSRREFEENVTQIRQDLEREHNEELNKLREQLNKASSNEKVFKVKIANLQNLNEKLNAKINEFNRIESNLNSRINELESLLDLEKNEKLDLLAEKEREIKELEDELKMKDNENQMVTDTNVQLNEEIRIYRNLIEEHEKSMENGNDPNTSQTTTRNGSPTSVRRFAYANRKRKRNIIEEFNESTILNKSIGPIAIDDSTDEFIRLINRSPEPVHLGGWQLTRENSEDGWSFKFSKSIIVQPNETVTVYSQDAENAVHSPPVSIKLKKNWPIGGTTILTNPNNQEIAKWEITFGPKRSKIFSSSGDQADKSCSLM